MALGDMPGIGKWYPCLPQAEMLAINTLASQVLSDELYQFRYVVELPILYYGTFPDRDQEMLALEKTYQLETSTVDIDGYELPVYLLNRNWMYELYLYLLYVPGIVIPKSCTEAIYQT